MKRTIITLFIIIFTFCLITSNIAITIGTVAYAKKRSTGDSDKGSSSDSSSGDKSSGGGDTGGSSNGGSSDTGKGDTNGDGENKDTNTQVLPDGNNDLNTGEPTTPQQQCDPATDTNCPPGTTITGPPNTVCPDGSTPDATGKCPQAPTGVDCSKTPNDPSCLPTPPSTTCPDGSQPDADDKCPTTITDNNTTEGGNGGGVIPGIIGDNQTLPGNGNDTGTGLTGNETVPNITNVTTNATSSNISKALSLSISIAKNPIVRGNIQTITFHVSDDEHPPKNIGGASIKGAIKYVTDHSEPISGTTDGNRRYQKSWRIGGNSDLGVFKVIATTSKDGYKSASKSDSFTVKQATPSPGGGGGGAHNQGARPAAVQQVKYFKESTDMPPNSPLYITNTSMHKDPLNDIIITGEIKNRGTSTANFVELISTFYNINNQTLGNKNTFTKPSILQSGQAAPFTMYLSPKEIPLDQINRVKYHISWKYAAAVPPPSSSSTTNRILAPPIM